MSVSASLKVDIQQAARVMARADELAAISEAPDALIATRVEDGQAVRTRPICAWPKKAVYHGSGSTDDAANFTCR